MIVIYTPKVTNRIKYTFDFVFTQYFGIAYQVIEHTNFTIVPENIYINYSIEKRQGFLHIFQDELLLATNVQPQKIFITKQNNLPVFFQTENQYDIQFDIFSCIFYLITRYEEYLLHEQDEHGRYKSSNSILAKPTFNFSPIVEEWLLFLKNKLLNINSHLLFKNYTFEYLPTFDVDLPFKYLGRNWRKHLPNIFTLQCWETLIGKEPDPLNIFPTIFDELAKENRQSIFFFLLNDDGQNNSKVSPQSKKYQNLIRTINAKYEIGWHPSYNILKIEHQQEVQLLQAITNKNIQLSRQHFLKISFPTYYRFLHTTGIKTDYSLAYPNVVGFRAGCSRPFYFFDIEKNETTDLLIQPSCLMDATFAYYRNENNFENFEAEFSILKEQLIKINGKLVAIFHNDLLSEEMYWKYFTFINTRNNKKI